MLRTRPWYYMHIFDADPADQNVVYVANTNFYNRPMAARRSRASRCRTVTSTTCGSTRRSRIWIEGNDGGATVSLNGGRTWSTQLNQPTAEMYRVAVDNQFPYHVYGRSAGHLRGPVGAEPNRQLSARASTRSAGTASAEWRAATRP